MHNIRLSKRFFHRYKKHLFPLILLTMLIILSLLRLSGSSVGAYHEFFYGPEHSDNNLVAGSPRLIRSDEFLVITPLSLIQSLQGYPEFNTLQNGGKDMGFLLDTPYYGWSAIFKPQNFAFFVLPFEFAFAFKWWLMLFSLIASAYYFFLSILRNQIILAILSSLVIGLSPFVFWWFQYGTLGPLLYGFALLTLGMYITKRFFQKKSDKKNHIKVIGACIAFVYISVCFALVLYPPFQIPILIVTVLFLIGYIIQEARDVSRKKLIQLLGIFASIGILTISICGLFVLSHQSTASTISNTAYPGKREVTPGTGDYVKRLFSTYLQPQLQRNSRGTQFFINQSESSNFLIPSTLMLVPSVIVMAWIYVKKRKIDWPLASLVLSGTIFFIHMFLPLPLIFSKLFFLHLVPQQRLLIGLGFLGIITLIYIVTKYTRKDLRENPWLSRALISYLLLCLTAMIWAGFKIMETYPGFISSIPLILLGCVVLWLGFALTLLQRLYWGLGILVGFSILSVVAIHPLYIGIGDLKNNRVIETIQKVSPKDSTWGVVDGTYFNNFPQIANRKSVSGVEFYPNKDFWEKTLGNEYEHSYNRYAHVIFSDNEETALLIQEDLLKISMKCDKNVTRYVDYFLSIKPLDQSCLKLIDTITYPKTNFYIYKNSLSN